MSFFSKAPGVVVALGVLLMSSVAYAEPEHDRGALDTEY